MYTLKGELKVIKDVQQISDSFKKREFVVTDASGQYEQNILLQTVQDRCDLLDKFKEGDNVEVSFFLRGREWTDPKTKDVKYFNSLDVWKIDSLEDAKKKVANDTGENFVAPGDDDLPF
jgi:ribosomal 30S subunit maturation factor RimM